MEYNVGDVLDCPECGCQRAKIIWKSKDGKTIGLKCPRSGYRHKRNSVVLISIQNKTVLLASHKLTKSL